jgi:hypothetical protein
MEIAVSSKTVSIQKEQSVKCVLAYFSGILQGVGIHNSMAILLGVVTHPTVVDSRQPIHMQNK